MGRKHDLGSMKPDDTPVVAPVISPKLPTGLSAFSPALKTVGVSFQKEIEDLDPALIDPSPITDRMEGGQEGYPELVALIRDNGQQVPILVRPSTETQGRYQVVYGRRRLRAAVELGRPVRALIKKLSDDELVIAQGQENAARTDLSFIERAQFAAALEKKGHSREIIMAALVVDKTTLSRLLKSANDIPADMIAAIGPAPKTGRDRWVALATRIKEFQALAGAYRVIREGGLEGLPSDDRFALVFKAASPKKTTAAIESTPLISPDGQNLGTFFNDPSSGMSVKMDMALERAFGDHFAQVFPGIYAAWKAGEDA